MSDKMYLAQNLDKEPLEIAAGVALGAYKNLSCFGRHMAARDYWLYVMHVPGPFPWATDHQASEWLKQFEEEV